MIIIVDANILFSAIITPSGDIAKILGNSALRITRVSCHFLATELHRHQAKLIKASRRSEISVMDDMYGYLRHVRIFDETFLDRIHLQEAKRLTEGVDLYDMDYVALTLQTGGILWTGDKKLTEHLKTLGFDRVVNTTELAELLGVS